MVGYPVRIRGYQIIYINSITFRGKGARRRGKFILNKRGKGGKWALTKLIDSQDWWTKVLWGYQGVSMLIMLLICFKDSSSKLQVYFKIMVFSNFVSRIHQVCLKYASQEPSPDEGLFWFLRYSFQTFFHQSVDGDCVQKLGRNMLLMLSWMLG